MAATEKYNIYIENYGGDSTDIIYQLSINVLNAEAEPLDTLLGAESVFTVKRAFRDTDPLVSVTTAGGITIDALTGTVSLVLTVADLADIPTNIEEQTFLYDWDLVDNTGKFYRLLKGEITLGGDL